MKHLLYFSVFLLLFGCSSNPSEKTLPLLNGYWEIKKVTFPDGTTKEYKASMTIDYIEIDNNKGFKKKMQPKFDGTYTTTNDTEYFSILNSDGALAMVYKNNLSEWKEQIKTISENSFSVLSEENVTYTYNRYQPINIQK
ncbi:MAG: lipocalin family protein [Cellulophaga sp.]